MNAVIKHEEYKLIHMYKMNLPVIDAQRNFFTAMAVCRYIAITYMINYKMTTLFVKFDVSCKMNINIRQLLASFS
jgi:hypothetical protein